MKDEEFIQKVWLDVLDGIDSFIIQNDEEEKLLKTFLDMGKGREIVQHENPKFKKFQDKYGAIPAGDKNNMHLIKSRMLQGIYRDKKDSSVYCNIILENDKFINFMRNEKLMKDVEKELKAIQDRERLTEKERLYTNLLSSQPLAFNIFLPLKWNNFEVGNAVFKELFPFLNIKKLVDIKMEYVPGDDRKPDGSIDRTTIDRSCFDVFVEYENSDNQIGGIGIEVKYTEPFSQSNYWDTERLKTKEKELSKEEQEEILKEKRRKKKRYTDEIEKFQNQFKKEHEQDYLEPRYNQLFRNQLIAELVKEKTEFKNCILAVVHSNEDQKCIEVVTEFQNLIKLENSCKRISIEQIIQSAIKTSASFPETKSLYEKINDRYCNYKKLEKYLE